MAEAAAVPSAEEVRTQLARLLACRELQGSERSRALLRHLVETTLVGRQAEIKAYTIAVDAFGRRDDFNAEADSTVRVEASRLRRKLRHYYLRDGAGDPVRIELPAQGYVPVFAYARDRGGAAPLAASAPGPRRVRFGIAALCIGLLSGAPLGLVLGFALPMPFRDAAPADAGMQASADRATDLPRGPRIAVAPFADLTGEARLGLLAAGMAEALTTRLAQQPDLLVLARAPREAAAPGERNGDGMVPAADFVVEGSVRADASRIRLTASLVGARERRILWRGDFDRPRAAPSLIALEDELTTTVLGALAAARGVELGLVAPRPRAVRDLAAYECVLEAAAYRRRKTPAAHALVSECLERAVLQEPDFSAAWASLALARLDEHFLRFNAGPDPLGRAAQAAEAAIRLEPEAALGNRAMLNVAFARGDLAAFHAAAERGIAQQPRNADLLADYGQKLAWLGDWQRARPLLVKAFLLDPDPPDWYRGVLVLDAYRRGAYLDAFAQLLAMQDQGALEASWLRAICLAQLGDSRGAGEALRRAYDLAPELARTIDEDLGRRHVPPGESARIREGLRKAADASGSARVSR